MRIDLWKDYETWKTACKFVDLSHELSPATPHWSGFDDMVVEMPFDYPRDGFRAHRFTLVSQYGTHADAPLHFVPGRMGLHEFGAKDLVLPLCVVDIRDRIAGNDDYAATRKDMTDWESQNGRFPQGAFVALRTDWSKREDMNNYDAAGNKHYPAWGLDVLKFLVEERGTAAIGHETSDTDSAVEAATKGYLCETYILDQNRYQIELMRNLSEVPAVGSLIFCGFPSARDAAGFTARCIAICPKDDA